MSRSTFELLLDGVEQLAKEQVGKARQVVEHSVRQGIPLTAAERTQARAALRGLGMASHLLLDILERPVPIIEKKGRKRGA